MSLLIFAIAIIVLLALVIWAMTYVPLPAVPKNLICALIILVGALVIAHRAGVF